MRLTLKSSKPHEFPGLPADLGQAIRRQRLKLGLGIIKLAKHLGVDRDTIRKWETRGQDPFPKHIPRILQFLGIPVEEARQSRQG